MPDARPVCIGSVRSDTAGNVWALHGVVDDRDYVIVKGSAGERRLERLHWEGMARVPESKWHLFPQVAPLGQIQRPEETE